MWKSFALCVVLLQLCQAAAIPSGLRNDKVSRAFDLQTQEVHEQVSIEFSNVGTNPVSQYVWLVEKTWAEHLHDLQVFPSEADPLEVTRLPERDTETYVAYAIELDKPLEPEDYTMFVVVSVYSHLLKPFPAVINQYENQKVLFTGNNYYSSPYATAMQTTSLKLASTRIESKSELEPVEVDEDVISYGPYMDVAPLTYEKLTVHFESNAAFLTVTSALKEIEVSHWGNMAVEEHYELRDDGAALEGGFSRLDFQRSAASSPSAVSSLRMMLPLGAADIYFRDETGNISTSQFSLTPHGVLLELMPRYPLFGGWKTAFYIGYNVPLANHLTNDYYDTSMFRLNTSFAMMFHEAVTDHLVTKVILPEGASDVAVSPPYVMDGGGVETRKTYLDTVGRPVWVFEKNDVVSTMNLPILTIAAGRDHRIGELLLMFQNEMHTMARIHDTLVAAVEKFKRTKQTPLYTQARGNIDILFNESMGRLHKIVSRMDELEPQLASKARDIVYKAPRKLELHDQLLNLDISFAQTQKKHVLDELKPEREKAFCDADDELELLMRELLDA